VDSDVGHRNGSNRVVFDSVDPGVLRDLFELCTLGARGLLLRIELPGATVEIGLPGRRFFFRLFQIDERNRNPSAVENWFATHPLEEDRIADTEKLIATYDPAILRSLTEDSRNFQTFKARVKALPPSPVPRG